MLQKIGFYIMSLWLLFFLILVYTIKIPFLTDSTWQYEGLFPLIKLNIIPLICLFMMVLGFIIYRLFVKLVENRSKGLTQKVNKIKDINYETVSFLITYIIPLLFFVVNSEISELRNFIVLTLTLLMIGIIYCRTNMFYTNPTLAIIGYHVYRVSTNQNDEMIIIVRGKLKKEESFYPRLIDDNIYYITKELKCKK